VQNTLAIYRSIESDMESCQNDVTRVVLADTTNVF